VLDGRSFDFVFDFATLKWVGTTTTTGGKLLALEMECSILGQPELTGTWTTHGELWDASTLAPPVLCDLPGPPFNLPLVFSNTVWQFEGAECGGSVTFVVDLP